MTADTRAMTDALTLVLKALAALVYTLLAVILGLVGYLLFVFTL
jgi:hypothetical protein